MGDENEFKIDPTSETPIPEPELPEEAQVRVAAILSDGMDDK